MEIQRFMFLEEENTGDDLIRAVLTFRLGWKTPEGKTRQIEAHQVLYGRPAR